MGKVRMIGYNKPFTPNNRPDSRYTGKCFPKSRDCERSAPVHNPRISAATMEALYKIGRKANGGV